MSETKAVVETIDIPVNQIEPSPYQPRLYFELETIKESITQDGMLVVPLLRRKPDGKTYELIDGERRWRAAQELGWKTIQVQIVDVDDETAQRMVFTLNEERQPYTAEEYTKFFRRMHEQMGSAYAVAKAFRKSQHTVWNYINVSMLPEHLQKAVWAGKIPMGFIAEMEPIFAEARDEIGDISATLHYSESPSYQRVVAWCERIYTKQIQSREELRKEYVDSYLEMLDKKRVEKAKEELQKVIPKHLIEPKVSLETPEELEKAAEALRKEAERRKPPEQKAEEKRQKLIAQARKSLNSVIQKINGVKKIIDVGSFRKRLDKLEKSLEQNPAEVRKQLIALGKGVTEAKKQRQLEIEEEKRKKREEEARRRLEEEMRRKLEEEKRRIEEETKVKTKKILLEDKSLLREASDRYKELLASERLAKRRAIEAAVEWKVTEADLVHKIIVGDARLVLKKMPKSSVDLVVTSPPYFDLKEYPEHPLAVNTSSLDRYLEDLKNVFKECFNVLKDGRFICVVVGQFTSNEKSYFIPQYIAQLLENIGFKYKREHIWVKPLGIQGIWNRGTTSFLNKPYPRNTMINIHHEHILIFQKGDEPTIYYGRNPLSTDEVKKWCWSIWELYVSQVKEHPAPFPQSVAERLIKMYSYEGENVLDPFLGSGTTIKVAKALKRRSIGIEVLPEYLPLIKKEVGGANIIRYDKDKVIDFNFLKTE